MRSLGSAVSADCTACTSERTRLQVMIVMILGLLGTVSLTTAQSLSWARLDRLPPTRYGHAMIYDSVRCELMVFGGAEADNPRTNQTWVFNQTWVRRDVPGPSPRRGHRMIFDSQRGVAVLFGGSTAEGDSGETWEWNGSSWTQRMVSGPSPRAYVGMAYDAQRGRTVLVGGLTVASETWEWDGNTWTMRTLAGPPPRSNCAAAYDPIRQVTVLFGGSVPNNQFLDDTWEWDGAAWTQRTVGARPLARALHAMIFDPESGSVILQGGLAPVQPPQLAIVGDTWRWDGVEWSRIASNGPHVDSQSLAFDAAQGRMVVFGGRMDPGPEITNQFRFWEDGVWRTHTALPRSFHATAFDTDRGVIVVFGGLASSRSADETWEWNGFRWDRRATTGPGARSGTAMAYDSARNVCVLFGGQDSGFLGDTWEWDGLSWVQRSDSGPAPRRGHLMVYDESRAVTVMAAGTTADTWEWDGDTWTQHGSSPPLSGAAATYDSSRNVIVMFGGAFVSASRATFEYNGTSWALRTTTGPSPRSGAAMAFDPTRGASVLFGGFGASGPNGDTWEWDGNSWSQHMIYGPTARAGHGMVYDTLHGNFAVLGGNGEETAQDSDAVWSLGSGAPGIEVQPVGQSVCTGGTAVFTASPSGPGPFLFQWRREGAALWDDPGHITGSNSETLTIMNSTESDEGGYTCTATNAWGDTPSSPATLYVCDHPADLTCDSQVGIADLAILLSNFGRSDSPQHADGDLDDDGTVGLEDLTLLLAEFGTSCP